MDYDLGPIRAIFFEEAAEHLVELEKGLLELEDAPNDKELIARIFRAAHSLKGGAATLGFAEIASLTHAAETILGRIRDGQLAVAGARIDLLLAAGDLVGKLVAVFRDEAGEQPSTLLSVLELLEADAAAPSDVREAGGRQSLRVERGPAHYLINFVPDAGDLLAGNCPLLVLRELSELGVVAELVVDAGRLPPLSAMDPEQSYLGWSLNLATREPATSVRDVFSFVEDRALVEITPLSDTAPPTTFALPHASTPSPKRESFGGASLNPPRLTVPSAALAAGFPQAAAVQAPAFKVQEPTPVPVMVRPHEDKAPAAEAHGNERSPKATTTAAGAATGTAAAAGGSSLRVPTEKVDQLVNLVGELVIAQSMVARALEPNGTIEKAREAASAMGRITQELQERVMKVRMVPIGTVFSRLPRMVRDLAGSLKKELELEIFGEETEMDKALVERVADPLLHLVRNAVDHGVEGPEARAKAGKSGAGRVTVRAFHQGTSIVIEVSDDGNGIDRERLREKAIGAGHIGANAQLNDDELAALVFLPGLSTAKVVTDVSGRGVGMDVVKRNIDELGGTIQVDSRRGVGSTFRLRLPLTLAVIDGQTVCVGSQTFVIPLGAIVASVRPQLGEVRTLPGGGEVVRRRGRMIPVARLHKLLGIPNAMTEPSRALLVVVETGSGELAVLVDQVLGQQSTVVKNLESDYRRVDGVMGATVDAEGGVTLILDVSALARANDAAQGSSGAFAN